MTNSKPGMGGAELKAVNLPRFDKAPRWLVIQGELDHRLYILKQMLKDDLNKPPINRMVDEATGYDKELTKQAQELIAECRWLKKEYDKDKS